MGAPESTPWVLWGLYALGAVAATATIIGLGWVVLHVLGMVLTGACLH